MLKLWMMRGKFGGRVVVQKSVLSTSSTENYFVFKCALKLYSVCTQIFRVVIPVKIMKITDVIASLYPVSTEPITTTTIIYKETV
jgi:hypothetical protein